MNSFFKMLTGRCMHTGCTKRSECRVIISGYDGFSRKTKLCSDCAGKLIKDLILHKALHGAKVNFMYEDGISEGDTPLPFCTGGFTVTGKCNNIPGMSFIDDIRRFTKKMIDDCKTEYSCDADEFNLDNELKNMFGGEGDGEV